MSTAQSYDHCEARGFGVCRDIVPLGQTKGKWNYNLDEKRVLNFENVVNDDDNIKQDLSIGRAPACLLKCLCL